MPKRRLREQRVTLPLGGGLDAKTAPRLIQPGQMLDIKNMTQERTGQLQTRPGGTALATTGYTDADGFRLASGPTGLVQIGKMGVRADHSSGNQTGGNVYEWSPSEDTWSARFNPRMQSSGAVRTRRTTVGAGPSGFLDAVSQRAPSCCYNSTHDVILVAWEDTGIGLTFRLLDGTTKGAINTGLPLQVPGGGILSNPRVVGSTGNYMAIVFLDSTSGDVKAYRIDVSGSQPYTAVTHTIGAFGGAVTATPFDVMEVSTTLVLAAYRDSVAGQLEGAEYNLSTGAVATQVLGYTHTLECLGWAHDNQGNSDYTLFAGMSGPDNVWFTRYSTGGGGWTAWTLVSSGDPSQQVTGYMTNASGHFLCYWEDNGDPDTAVNGSFADIYRAVYAGVADPGGSVYMRDATLLSHAFIRGGDYWFFVRNNSADGEPLQNTDFLCPALDTSDTYTDNPGAALALNRWEAGRALRYDGVDTGRLSRVYAYPNGYIHAFTTLKRTLGIEDAVADQLATLVEITPDDSTIGPSVKYGCNLYSPGGYLQLLSGAYVGESDPLFYPHTPDAVSSASPGSLVAGQTYSYRAVYAGVNAAGDVVRSAPSAVDSITISGGHSSASVVVKSLRLGGRTWTEAVGDIFVELYRTTAGGSLYFLTDTIFNLHTVHGQTIVDTRSDASLQSQEPLYTTGGVLEAHAPPAPVCLALYRDRMWAVDMDRPTFLWFTLRKAVGTAFRWNETQRIEIDDGTGEITALAVVSERLLIFKRRAVYVLQGEGPNDIGQGGYAAPQQLPIDIGTANPMSVVVTSIGCFFQETESNQIHLIGNDLTHQYIGRPIETLSVDRITGAVHMRSRREVRFYTSTGVALIYDLNHGSWSQWTEQPALSAVAHEGTAYYLNSSFATIEEDSSGEENGSVISGVWQTPHLQLAGVGGYKRVWEILLTGDVIGDCTVRVQLYYDAATVLSDETLTQAVTAGNKLEMHIYPERQQCSSISVRVTLTYSGGQSSANGGVKFSAITLRLGIKPGTDKSIDVTSRV